MGKSLVGLVNRKVSSFDLAYVRAQAIAYTTSEQEFSSLLPAFVVY